VPLPTTIDGFHRAFALVQPEGLVGYINGGASEGLTVGRNADAWQSISVRPRMLANAGAVDTSVTVLGRPLAHPIMIAPMGFQELLHPGGGRLVAQAAAATQTLYCHSTFASASFAELESVDGLNWWFQLYAFADWGLTLALVDRAIAAGAGAIVLTVDLATLGLRQRDVDTGFTLRGKQVVPCLAEAGASDPRLAPMWASLHHDLTWDSLAQIVAHSTVPVVVKGLLRGDDALLAVEHGASGIIVSNHGGRQLDTAVPTAYALPEIVEAVNGTASVMVDSGIRSGLDVVKAIALGADAAFIGRPVQWGLSLAGAEGVQRVMSLLLDDFTRSLVLVGARKVSRLDRSIVAMPDRATLRN